MKSAPYPGSREEEICFPQKESPGIGPLAIQRISVMNRWLLLLVAALLSAPAPAATPPPATAPVEPQALRASAAVQQLLDESSHEAQAKRQDEALKAAESALAAARAASDAVGEAKAQAARARTL